MDHQNEQQETTPQATGQKPRISKKTVIIGVNILLFITLLLLGGMIYLNKTKKSSPSSATQTSKTAVFEFNEPVFAEYKEIKSSVKPSLQPYTLKSAELINLNEIAGDTKTQFTTFQLASLETNGFFIQPVTPKSSDPTTTLNAVGDRSDDMVDMYRQFGGKTAIWERKPENAVFVSTDFLIHVYHVLVDRTFQKTEEVYFYPALKSLTQALYDDALSKYNSEENASLKNSWKRLAAFYLVPNTLLSTGVVKPKDYFGTPDEQEKYSLEDKSADSPENVKKHLQTLKDTTPNDIYTLAQQELDLVMKSEGFGVPSPLYKDLKPDSPEDYTQYTPRSHYTRNSVLRNYFRSMMWFGRHGFETNNPDLTQDALLMTFQLGSVRTEDKTALQLWESIYLPTVFFVGKSDDLSVYEYAELMQDVYGDTPSYNDLSDASKLGEFRQKAQKLTGPKILSEIKIFDPSDTPTKDELLQSTKGFRFMGQRFIPDSYMFTKLTQGQEKADDETKQKLPSTPTALMVMSILGSQTADVLLGDWIVTNAPQSDKIIAKVKNQLKNEVQKYDEKTWTQNIYWSWLYNMLPLFEEHDEGYPMFMRGLAWSKKSLLTALGTWTELRHDTLLYAKQSFAELGGGGGEPPPPPPVPKGYVEPNLPFITRLIALATMTRDGLESREIMVPGQKEKFDSFIETLEFFKIIAEKELSDSVISDDEYEKLRTIIRLNYPNIVWTPNGEEMTERDARAGIIADVHSDALKGQILYEATGVPSVIYVAVKDKGGARLTRGAAYSYYEFTKPAGGPRLTDDTWQGMIYVGKSASEIPQRPQWSDELMR